MDKKVLKQSLYEDIQTAQSINAFLKTKEWKIFEDLVDKKEKDLFTIFLENPEDDLAMERQGITYMRELINEFRDLINTGVKAKMNLDIL